MMIIVSSFGSFFEWKPKEPPRSLINGSTTFHHLLENRFSSRKAYKIALLLKIRLIFQNFSAHLRNLSYFDILERNQFPDYWQKDGLLAVGGGDFNASCFVFHDLKSNPRVTPRAKIRRKTKTST